MEARNQRQNLISNLIKSRKIPDEGFDDFTIERIVGDIAELDSNNFTRKTGVGEREGRIACGKIEYFMNALIH